MAAEKITEKDEIGGALASGDQLIGVDVSDTSQAATGTTKRINASRIAQIGAANTFTGPQTVNPASGVAITAQGVAGQDIMRLLTAAGTTTLSISDTGGLTTRALRSGAVTLADDAVVDLIADYEVSLTGILLIMSGSAVTGGGVIGYRAASGPFCGVVAQNGTSVSTGTTDLTAGAGDGVDGNLNIHATAGGKLWLKNRIGGTRNFSFLSIGG